LVILLGAVAAAAAGVAVVRHARGAAKGREEQGGIAADAAAVAEAVAPEGARVLEVGCGPGHLSIRLARQHGLHTTALDLDPAMIERARANADRAGEGFGRLPPGSLPSFLVGDVASLPFPDGSFDLVVSTMSMHHWADPAAGLAEIARVLRPGARALVWVFRLCAVARQAARSGRAHSGHSASHGKRGAVALALEVQPHAAHRARTRR
jgi:SAM-dependent methyltransferase